MDAPNTKKPLQAKGTRSEGIARLLNLLYGLVITTGFGLTFRGLLAGTIPSSKSCYLFLFFAFIVALCDWVIYQFAAAPFAYQGIRRVFLDLLFPIGLFVISLYVNNTCVVLILLALYFGLSAVYALVEVYEVEKLPSWNIRLGFSGAIICLVGAELYHLGKVSDTTVAWSFGILVAIPWFCFWFIWLRSKLSSA